MDPHYLHEDVRAHPHQPSLLAASSKLRTQTFLFVAGHQRHIRAKEASFLATAATNDDAAHHHSILTSSPDRLPCTQIASRILRHHPRQHQIQTTTISLPLIVEHSARSLYTTPSHLFRLHDGSGQRASSTAPLLWETARPAQRSRIAPLEAQTPYFLVLRRMGTEAAARYHGTCRSLGTPRRGGLRAERLVRGRLQRMTRPSQASGIRSWDCSRSSRRCVTRRRRGLVEGGSSRTGTRRSSMRRGRTSSSRAVRPIV